MESGLSDQGRSLLLNPNTSVEPLKTRGRQGSCPLVSLLQGWWGTSPFHSGPQGQNSILVCSLCPTPTPKTGLEGKSVSVAGSRMRHSVSSSYVFTWVLCLFSLLLSLWVVFYLIRFLFKMQYNAALLRRSWGCVSPLGPKWKLFELT